MTADPPGEDLFCACVMRSTQLVDLEYQENAGISEETVKDQVYRQLTRDDYSAKKNSPHGKGPDIEGWSAQQGDMVVEAKGEGSRPEMFHNFFLAAIGQIVLRMSKTNARYVVALPIHENFVKLVRKVPQDVRRKLNLEFWLVGSKPVSYSIHILRPDAD
jgi:hypothetical protein